MNLGKQVRMLLHKILGTYPNASFRSIYETGLFDCTMRYVVSGTVISTSMHE